MPKLPSTPTTGQSPGAVFESALLAGRAGWGAAAA